MPLEIRHVPPDVARDRILAVILDHGRDAGLPFQVEEVAIEAWDGAAWRGGLTGRISQSWMFVFLLAIATEARSQRLGARLMEEAERLARERDLIGLWLDTYSFQTPGFYLKLGFQEVGRISDHPPGQFRVFLAKRLDGRPVHERPTP